MKEFLKILGAAALISTAPAIASAQIDYSTFTAEVPVTTADIAAFTGQTTVSMTAITVDSNGDLITFTRRGAADSNAQLVKIDISGPTPQFTTLATEAQLLAQMDSTGPIVYHLDVDSAGTVYMQEWVNSSVLGDDILKIVPNGATPTVTNLRRVIGVTGVNLSQDEQNLIICQSDNFFAPTNNIVMRAVDGTGSDVVLASASSITAVTGGTQAELRNNLVPISNGNYIGWDESIFGGTDQLLEITPAGAVSVVLTTAQVNPPIGANSLSLASDDNDAIYMWSAVAASSDFGVLIFEDGGSGAQHKHQKADIDSALATAHGSSFPIVSTAVGGHFATHSTPSRKTLYITTDGGIAALHFEAAGSSIGQWDSY